MKFRNYFLRKWGICSIGNVFSRQVQQYEFGSLNPNKNCTQSWVSVIHCWRRGDRKIQWVFCLKPNWIGEFQVQWESLLKMKNNWEEGPTSNIAFHLCAYSPPVNIFSLCVFFSLSHTHKHIITHTQWVLLRNQTFSFRKGPQNSQCWTQISMTRNFQGLNSIVAVSTYSLLYKW